VSARSRGAENSAPVIARKPKADEAIQNVDGPQLAGLAAGWIELDRWKSALRQPPIAQNCLGIYYTLQDGGIVKELKTVSVSFRVSPRFKRALEIAAASVNRTRTNFLETLLFEYCDTQGIDIELTQGDTQMGDRKSK
jgi:hypothetical protein